MTLCPELRRLSAQHARWLARLASRERGAEEDRRAGLLAIWEAEILPHCRAEEDVLLPALAGRLSEADAAILFTLGDHIALRRLARELRVAEGPDRSPAREAMERKLAEHTRFEEHTLFPALQEALGCDRIAGLAAEMKESSRTATPNRRKGSRP